MNQFLKEKDFKISFCEWSNFVSSWFIFLDNKKKRECGEKKFYIPLSLTLFKRIKIKCLIFIFRPYLFLQAVLDPLIQWRSRVYKLKWGGIAEEVKAKIKYWGEESPVLKRMHRDTNVCICTYINNIYDAYYTVTWKSIPKCFVYDMYCMRVKEFQMSDHILMRIIVKKKEKRIITFQKKSFVVCSKC